MALKIARVFPSRTKMTPIDEDVYIGRAPSLLDMKYDEIHISCTFTLRRDVDFLADSWEKYGTVRIGGPAFGDPGGEFTPGMYIKKGVTITSRGCIRKCQFCYVPGREGKIREIEIHPGNIIQDNNLLACSKGHIKKVFEMLRTQKTIDFAGGLDARLLKDWVIEELRSLSIYQLWFAYDHGSVLPALKKVAERLTPHFKRNKLRCYVLVGYGSDTVKKAEERLRMVYELGFLPFAMEYDRHYTSTNEWYNLIRTFSRPAATKAYMEPKEPEEQLFKQEGDDGEAQKAT